MPRRDAFRAKRESYLEMLATTRRSPATVRKYGEILNQLRAAAVGMGLTGSPSRWELSEAAAVLESVLTWPDGRLKANATQNLYTTVLRQFLVYCHNSTLDRAIKTREYRLPPATRTRARWPSLDQVVALKAAARGCAPGTYIMVVLAFDGLIRRDEMAGLMLDDIREGYVHIHGKGRKDRELYISMRTRMEIKAYIDGDRLVSLRGHQSPHLLAHAYYGRPSPYAGGTIFRRVQEAGQLSDPPFVVSPHDLRRGGARAVYQADPSERTLSKLQEALGHSSIDQTRAYIGIGIIDQADAMEARDRYIAERYPEMYLSEPGQASTER